MSSHYLIEGPALISFSGGRTSGFMLRQILDAHGGGLPDDVHVCFANTGKEREETLDFVHQCAARWNVGVRWLEWRPPSSEKRGAPKWTEVSYGSADREGRWFAELIRRKQYLPNPVMRYCTIELKIRVMRDFMKAQGYKTWTNAVGLRADEMVRVGKLIERSDSGKECFTSIAPMARAGHRLEDVKAFWREQPFDLQLQAHEGNCDLCFLKGRGKRAEIIRADPTLADWWIAREDTTKCSKPDGARFRADETYRQLVDQTLASPLLPLPYHEEDEDHDAECGLICGGEFE